MMVIKRDAFSERSILDSCKESFERDDVGRNETTHLSELLQLRQAFWKREVPMPLTDSEVQYFIAGRGHEDALGRVAGLVVTPQEVIDGISLRPDFTINGVPGEMKTRRANLAKPGEEAFVYKGYIDQLRGYCALKRSRQGILIVFSLLEGRSGDPFNPTHPELACYLLDFSEAELARERANLQERKKALHSALKTMEHSALPLCESWLCGKNVKTIVTRGACETCGEMNEPWLSRHPQTKTGAGHVIVPEVAEWVFTPRCKWYGPCQPQLVDPMRGSR